MRAAIVVLPGGKAASTAPGRPTQVAVARMRPLVRSLRAAGGVGVVLARYRQQGWNGDGADRVADGLAALDEATRAHGDTPVVLLGHSMGGRVAAHLAQDPRVAGVVALAPWWPDGEGLLLRPAQDLVVVHGTRDRWTDPAQSRAQTLELAARGHSAQWIPVEGAGHFMLRPLRRWHDLAVGSALRLARHAAADAA